jgi:hypothetical protein
MRIRTLIVPCVLCAAFPLVGWLSGAEHAKPVSKAAPEVKHVQLPGRYMVVVSQSTRADTQWGRVVVALTRKYSAEVVVYDKNVADSRGGLARGLPRYVAFVARPEETGREFVVRVNRLMRELDDDPYTDALWGILTGYRAADALRIATVEEPLLIRKAAAGTDIDLTLFDRGIWYSESEKNACFEKRPGGKVERKSGPDDTTKDLVGVLNQFQPDLFVTSGHATDRDWQIGYSYRNGQFRCKDGVLYGIDCGGQSFRIDSPNPKVYLPAGNCLMGRIRDNQSMALAWMSSAGVNQMIGYVVSTWYGRGGWGTRDYFFGEPGRYCLAEAFFFNNQTLVHDLWTRFPKSARAKPNEWDIESNPRLLGGLAASLGYRQWSDEVKDNVGLLWDRDTVAFYGDPAWDARLAPRPLPFDQRLLEVKGVYTFQIDAKDDCSPARPPAMFLPCRLGAVQVLQGAELMPLITDDFIMLMRPGRFERGKAYRVVFQELRAARDR